MALQPTRRLTLPSSGLAPAAQAWPSFHSGPSPRYLREPLMSNVRRHKSIERQLRVKLEVQQLQCNRSALERSAPRRVELASGEIHGQPSWQTGFKVPHAAVFTGAEPWRIEGRTPSPCRPPVPPAGGRLTRAAAWTNRNSKNLLLRHILVRHTIRQREEECEHKLTEFARVQVSFRGATP